MSNTEIGERLRIIRTYRRWSQERLGTAIHADQTKISNLERGISTASLSDMALIAQALCFSLDVFYTSDPFDLLGCLKPMP